MIEGVHLAVHHMSTRNGGNGGVVINTASVAGDHEACMLVLLYNKE